MAVSAKAHLGRSPGGAMRAPLSCTHIATAGRIGGGPVLGPQVSCGKGDADMEWLNQMARWHAIR